MATEGDDPGAPIGLEPADVPPALRTRQLLELELAARRDFDDPKLEWRRLFAEMLGTFFLGPSPPVAGSCTRRDRSASPRPWSHPG